MDVHWKWGSFNLVNDEVHGVFWGPGASHFQDFTYDEDDLFAITDEFQLFFMAALFVENSNKLYALFF